MANDFRISVNSRNAAAAAYGAIVNGGPLEIRTNAPPGTLGDPSGSALLATVTFGDPAFATASNGSVSGNPITPDTASLGGGDAGHFVGFEVDGTTPAFQGTCGDANDAPVDMQFDNKTIINLGQTSVSTFVITQPE